MNAHSLGLGGICVALLSLLTACASPREHLYTLEAASDENLVNVTGRAAVLVDLVKLPELVDRPQIVVRDGKLGIKLIEQQRWASPLKESIPRVLAAELNQHLPDHRFGTTSTASGAATARLTIEITRFEIVPNTGARIAAHWLYRPVETKVSSSEGEAQVQERFQTAGYEGYVDALRRATIALANAIAEKLAAG